MVENFSDAEIGSEINVEPLNSRDHQPDGLGSHEWTLYYSPEGYPYHYNEQTGESKWDEDYIAESLLSPDLAAEVTDYIVLDANDSFTAFHSADTSSYVNLDISNGVLAKFNNNEAIKQSSDGESYEQFNSPFSHDRSIRALSDNVSENSASDNQSGAYTAQNSPKQVHSYQHDKTNSDQVRNKWAETDGMLQIPVNTKSERRNVLNANINNISDDSQDDMQNGGVNSDECSETFTAFNSPKMPSHSPKMPSHSPKMHFNGSRNRTPGAAIISSVGHDGILPGIPPSTSNSAHYPQRLNALRQPNDWHENDNNGVDKIEHLNTISDDSQEISDMYYSPIPDIHRNRTKNDYDDDENDNNDLNYNQKGGQNGNSPWHIDGSSKATDTSTITELDRPFIKNEFLTHRSTAHQINDDGSKNNLKNYKYTKNNSTIDNLPATNPYISDDSEDMEIELHQKNKKKISGKRRASGRQNSIPSVPDIFTPTKRGKRNSATRMEHMDISSDTQASENSKIRQKIESEKSRRREIIKGRKNNFSPYSTNNSSNISDDSQDSTNGGENRYQSIDTSRFLKDGNTGIKYKNDQKYDRNNTVKNGNISEDSYSENERARHIRNNNISDDSDSDSNDGKSYDRKSGSGSGSGGSSGSDDDSDESDGSSESDDESYTTPKLTTYMTERNKRIYAENRLSSRSARDRSARDYLNDGDNGPIFNPNEEALFQQFLQSEDGKEAIEVRT